MIRALCTAFLALALLVAARPAAHAETDAEVAARVEALAKEGRALYDDGDYAGAVKRYLEAYQLAPSAGALYNIAFVYDKKLGEIGLAINYYRRYVADPDAEPDAVARATRRIEELKALQAQRAAKPKPASSAQRVAGWVTLGAGGLLVAGGVTFGVLASDAESEFDASRDLEEKRELRDQAETQALVSDVLLGTGLVAAAVGVVLVVTGDDDDSSSSVQVGASFDRDAGGRTAILFNLRGAL